MGGRKIREEGKSPTWALRLTSGIQLSFSCVLCWGLREGAGNWAQVQLKMKGSFEAHLLVFLLHIAPSDMGKGWRTEDEQAIFGHPQGLKSNIFIFTYLVNPELMLPLHSMKC